MINEMQESILNQLKTIKDIAVEAYPDEPRNYRLKHKNGAALLRYMGASFRNNGTEPFETVTTWQMNLMMKSLKGGNGVYAKLDEVRGALTWFKPEKSTGMIPIKEGFIAEEDGIWNYFIQFRTTSHRYK